MLGYKTFMEDAMRRLYPLLLCLCLMLTGCQRRDIQAEFEALSSRLAESGSLSFTANVRAEYEDKTARFTLGYEENAEGGTVTVLAPELIKGIKAHVGPGGTQLQYDSVVLDTGSLDNFGLSPLSSLPVLLQALKAAHLDSFWEEDGMSVLQLEPEDQLKCTVWFESESMIPLRAEIASGGRVTVYIEISDWNEG